MDGALPPVGPARPTFAEGTICIPTGDSSYRHHSLKPFLLVPQLVDMNVSTTNEPATRPRPSFPVTRRTDQGLMPSTPGMHKYPQLQPPTFKAPAHKHAHHLHSIPPREKTTRTLILDHMLWLHGRARLSQARAELGMSVLGDGEEEEEYTSEADDVEDLGYGVDKSMAMSATSASSSPNATQVKAFKARADGLEKVLSAMLDQPPDDIPFDHDDLLLRDTSFVPKAQPLLPNGVRLRLAIAALVNDIFAEDTHTVRSSPHGDAGFQSVSIYTPSLSSLTSISSFAHKTELPRLPSFQSFSAAAGAGADQIAAILPPPGSIFSSIPRGAGPESPWALGSSANVRSQAFPPFNRSTPSSSSTQGTSRYPLSFPLEPSDSSSLAPPPRVFRAVGRAKDLYTVGAHRASVQPGELPHRVRRCARHFSSSCLASVACIDATTTVTAKGRTRARSSIGAGLSSSGPPLRRDPYYGDSRGMEVRMVDLIPRFLRLSALVAIELGREARGEEWDVLARMDLGKRKEPDSGSSKSDSDDEAWISSSGRNKFLPARPTRAWYALLAGLLTRATLQGYLVKGWRGTDPVEILLGVGLGSQPAPFAPPTAAGPSEANTQSSNTITPVTDDDENSEEKEFEPDDMPELRSVWSILFGKKSSSPGKIAYEEYERVMSDRIAEFFTISSNSEDLSAHLEELTRKYPAEPTERATLRYCEAVACWRGRPELETTLQYKARLDLAPTSPASFEGPLASLSINSLIHPQPPQKPSIERYFSIARPRDSGRSDRRDSMSSNSTAKRSRRNSWADVKGKKVAIGQAWVEEDEYVGPYGV